MPRGDEPRIGGYALLNHASDRGPALCVDVSTISLPNYWALSYLIGVIQIFYFKFASTKKFHFPVCKTVKEVGHLMSRPRRFYAKFIR